MQEEKRREWESQENKKELRRSSRRGNKSESCGRKKNPKKE